MPLTGTVRLFPKLIFHLYNGYFCICLELFVGNNLFRSQIPAFKISFQNILIGTDRDILKNM